uniref:Uncharacterized protein n=1 Tax=Haptolina ericina TaxID=156174 RepID=A0A7S3AXE9_9EUKA
MLLLLRPEEKASVCVDSIRADIAAAFPLAATKQTAGLVHVSLARVISLPLTEYGANSSAARTASEVCERWTARLRGLRTSARGMVYVREKQMMTLEGDWHRLPFGRRRARD